MRCNTKGAHFGVSLKMVEIPLKHALKEEMSVVNKNGFMLSCYTSVVGDVTLEGFTYKLCMQVYMRRHNMQSCSF